MITASPITWTAEDAPSSEEEIIEPLECTEAEVYEALENNTLTADHCLWLHEHGVNWQITVR